MVPLPPKILTSARDEFTSLSRSANKSKLLFSILGYSTTLVISGMSTIITLTDYFSIPGYLVKVFGGCIIFANSIGILSEFEKRSHNSKLIILKTKSFVKSITRKIEEWNEYFSSLPEGESAVPPDDFSTKNLFEFINSFYRELDELRVSSDLGDSYNRVTSP